MRITRFRVVGIIYVLSSLISIIFSTFSLKGILLFYYSDYSKTLFTQAIYFLIFGFVVFAYDYYKEKHKALAKYQKLAFIISLIPLIFILLIIVLIPLYTVP